MKKVLIKYLLNTVKNQPTFENRMVEVLNRGLSGETAMEILTIGCPIKIVSVNTEALKEVLEIREEKKVVDITTVSLLQDTRIKVFFNIIRNYYFDTKEEMENAVASNNVSKDGHTYEGIRKYCAEGLYEDYSYFDIEELEGIVEVERR